MRGAALLLLATAHCAAQQPSDFAGVWVQKLEGRVIRVLTLQLQPAGFAGSMVQPKDLSLNQEGDFNGVASKTSSYPLSRIALSGTRLEFVFADDPYVMTLAEDGRATLRPLDDDFPFPPWKLERSIDPKIAVARDWPAPNYPAGIVALQKRLKAMVAVDQKVRLADKISIAKMEAVDREHLAEVTRIHRQYGWPKISVVGREASHDYWLLVQHQTPEVQREILPDLEKAANAGEASKSDFAYLYDRVQVGLGRPQRWGTQVSCKEGKPVLDPVEDLANLDQRRKELFMIPIDRYMKSDYLLRICAQSPAK